MTKNFGCVKGGRGSLHGLSVWYCWRLTLMLLSPAAAAAAAEKVPKGAQDCCMHCDGGAAEAAGIHTAALLLQKHLILLALLALLLHCTLLHFVLSTLLRQLNDDVHMRLVSCIPSTGKAYEDGRRTNWLLCIALGLAIAGHCMHHGMECIP